MSANPLILFNRENTIPDGEKIWKQIEVSGEHKTLWGDEVVQQVIDREGREKIVRHFEELKNTENFAGVLVDADHLSHDVKHSTRAQGWLWDVREGDGGHLQGLIEFTGSGRTAIENKDYKFFSTEYDPDSVERLDGNRIRPTRLVGLALTNRPNNKGGKPITNRSGDPGDEPNPQKNTTMKNIAEKLGLSEDATEEDIVAAIGTLQERAGEADELKAEAEAEEILNRHAKRIPAGKRDAWKEKLIANREDTEALLQTLPEREEKNDGPEKTGRKPITNRDTATDPDPSRATHSEDTGAEERRAAVITNRAREIRTATPGMSLTESYRAAESEIAEKELIDG